MNVLKALKDFWKYLKKDTWDSWLVSLVLAFVLIKFVFFPLLSLSLATPLPLVVVESCSMYHSTDFDDWWDRNSAWYEDMDIEREDFESFPFTNGMNKGDIVLVSGRGEYEAGDVIIFNANFRNPLIHRVVEVDGTDNEFATKGDNNRQQLEAEKEIPSEQVLGKAVARVPGIGWLKLIFFESFREPSARGFCR